VLLFKNPPVVDVLPVVVLPVVVVLAAKLVAGLFPNKLSFFCYYCF